MHACHRKLQASAWHLPMGHTLANVAPPDPKQPLHSATSAPGLGSVLPHLHRDWAHCCHICAGTGLTAATSAPGLGSPLPHLHSAWALPPLEPSFAAMVSFRGLLHPSQLRLRVRILEDDLETERLEHEETRQVQSKAREHALLTD